MATVKKYNLAGLNANVELGKRGSYITGGSDEIGFYANGGTLQKLKIADATVATEAVTKSQLDAVAADLVHHVTLDFDYDSGSSNIATIAAGTRIISVTVDIPSAWTASNNTATFVEVGDSDNASRFIRAGDVDILKVAQYHSQFQYEYSAETVMTLAVTQGTASAGAGTVSLVLAGESTVTDYGSITSSQNSNNDLGDITT